MTDRASIGAALIVGSLLGGMVYWVVYVAAPTHLYPALGLVAIFTTGLVLIAAGDDDE